ncbi:conserved Plasmodium protein, unknown function [Plasmodium ovale]|uniref:Uncharacterized protein n=1 Tax=Plasmodium ovale TaxID=36330 RepID=A0A1D3TK42_PLAOA|nr:conserved Plasmodium protein, unknown function [Plasmodium ovale]
MQKSKRKVKTVNNKVPCDKEETDCNDETDHGDGDYCSEKDYHSKLSKGTKEKKKEKEKEKDVEVYGINDFLCNKDNSRVLKKFFLFVILIILSPVILIILYKYIFIRYLRIPQNNSLLFSVYFVIVYIFSLTILYAYLAFKEDNRYVQNTVVSHLKKYQ